jgi:hypothetical protein
VPRTCSASRCEASSTLPHSLIVLIRSLVLVGATRAPSLAGKAEKGSRQCENVLDSRDTFNYFLGPFRPIVNSYQLNAYLFAIVLSRQNCLKQRGSGFRDCTHEPNGFGAELLIERYRLVDLCHLL